MSEKIAKVGFWSALLTTLFTIVTFGIAIFTPPLSGPYCTENCFNYPYTDITSRFPRDYLWMYPAILLALVYYILLVSIHCFAPENKKIFTHIGVSFGLISTAILVIDYFLQISVIQPSLLRGETEGIALLTQFNAHGIFIALEEIGFLMMSLSLLFMSAVFSGRNKLDKAIRWIFISCFVLTIMSFIIYSIIYGINKEYHFEVAAISINWITLIISGILLSIFFKRVTNKNLVK